jgi:hypothetical protein
MTASTENGIGACWPRRLPGSMTRRRQARGPSAIRIPPETPEEAAEDAAFDAAWAARPKAETTRRVVTGSPERHAGLAMIALAVHEDATSLHFHFVGESSSVDAPGPHSRRAFGDLLDWLGPPALRGNHGAAYEPVEPRPISASSHSREPDSDPRQVIIGTWLYTPSAPDEATSFEIEQTGGRRTLPPATLTGRGPAIPRRPMSPQSCDPAQYLVPGDLALAAAPAAPAPRDMQEGRALPEKRLSFLLGWRLAVEYGDARTQAKAAWLDPGR